MIDWRIHKVAVTTSTNDDAKQAAEQGESEGYVVWALRQLAGRGRQGRVWESPEGNLYCSVLLRPRGARTDIGRYSFVAALALYDTVHAALPHAVINLKWPNDVLVDGKKISGILLESVGEGLILGMGLNVARHPTETLYPTTSLAAWGATNLSLDNILDQLLNALNYWSATLQTKGFEPIRSAWLEKAVKGPLTVRLPQETLTGDFADLDPNGCLRLHLADGAERVIASGDVFIQAGL